MVINVNKTIVLVGLMGAGKSSIGVRLAKDIGVEFVDLDKVIEEKEKTTVSEIFASKGEAYFRKLEKEIIEDLLKNKPPHILATGGGAYMIKEIRELIRQYGISVWLKADIEVLYDRVVRKNTRPLLETGDKREILAKLIEERYPVYAYSDIAVDSDNRPHEYMVAKILEEIKKFTAENE